MAKNKKVTLNRSTDLESVDEELESAMDRLSSQNDKIAELLAGMDPPPAVEEPSAPEGEPVQNAPDEGEKPAPETEPQEPENEAQTSS